MMNAFPTKNGISDTLSPATIIEGKPKLDFSRGMVTFELYALVYAGTSDDMNPRAVPAIILSMSNNAGGHNFISIHTEKEYMGIDRKNYHLMNT